MGPGGSSLLHGTPCPGKSPRCMFPDGVDLSLFFNDPAELELILSLITFHHEPHKSVGGEYLFKALVEQDKGFGLLDVPLIYRLLTRSYITVCKLCHEDLHNKGILLSPCLTSYGEPPIVLRDYRDLFKI